MGKRNFPNQTIDETLAESPGFVADTLGTLKELSALPKIRGSSQDDEAFRKRCDQYIDICQRDNLRPGIESFCLACGITRQCLLLWESGSGCSPQRQQDVQKFKQVVHAFLEAAGTSGKLNPVTFIFLSKTWMQYREAEPIEYQIDARPRQTAAEIMEKYRNAELPRLEDEDIGND